MLESDKLISSKNSVFVGIGYSCFRTFKLSIDKIVSYIVEFSSLWHGKYINKLGLLSYNKQDSANCEISIQGKIHGHYFHKHKEIHKS